MFPAVGEAVDCSARPAERTCSTGWVRDEMKTLPFGCPAIDLSPCFGGIEFKPVTPAKAGVQPWIPAFAGMTR